MADFSTAIATWKEINLTDLQKSLDSTALELVENQKENMVGRKKLAEQTREFRKMPTDDAEYPPTLKALLKAYQTEIDLLTKRSKVSESSFLNLYKLLSEAPDPYPLLEVAVDQTVRVAEARIAESELERVKEELAESKKKVEEAAKDKEKLKKMEERVETMEKKMEEMVSEKVGQKENELNATYDERMRNYEDRERDLLRQLRTTSSQLRDARTSSDTSAAKLLESSTQKEGEVVAKLEELDMVVGDLERANSRVAAVERRNEILRAEIEAVRSGSSHVDRAKLLESQIHDLESSASSLLRALDTEKESKSQLGKTLQKKIDTLEKEVNDRVAECEVLRGKLIKYADYDEIKRELEIMKFVEFSTGDADDQLSLPDPNGDKNVRAGATLEVLLSAKNKRILDDLTKIRVAHDDLVKSQVASEATLKTVQSELDKQKSLNDKLENDLLHMNKHSNGRTTNDDTATTSNGSGLSGLDLGTSKRLSSEVVSGTRSPDPSVAGKSVAGGADTSILPIVTSQRDRFRARNAELEEELRKQTETITDLRTEIKTLQADNLKLYEKVRYIGQYRDESSSSSGGPSLRGSAAGGGHNTSLMSVGLNGLVRNDEIGKYKDKYDESLNPFEAFKGREAQRAIQALNPIERAVFTLSRAIIGNRRARSLFVLYAATLHLLVMFTIWGFLGGANTELSAPIRPV